MKRAAKQQRIQLGAQASPSQAKELEVFLCRLEQDDRLLLEVLENPVLGWGRCPRRRGLLLACRAGSGVPATKRLLLGELARLLQERWKEFTDPYLANIPPAEATGPAGPGSIPLCTLPTGNVVGMPVEAVDKNVLVVGPTGGGKSTWLKNLVLALLEAEA